MPGAGSGVVLCHLALIGQNPKWPGGTSERSVQMAQGQTVQHSNTKHKATHVTGEEANLRTTDPCPVSPVWVRDAEDPMGSLREHSAQYVAASEEGSEVPQLTRSGMETNRETAVVISSTATAQAELSMGCTPGRTGDGTEGGTGKISTSKNPSELIQRRREDVSTCTVLWTRG